MNLKCQTTLHFNLADAINSCLSFMQYGIGALDVIKAGPENGGQNDM